MNIPQNIATVVLQHEPIFGEYLWGLCLVTYVLTFNSDIAHLNFKARFGVIFLKLMTRAGRRHGGY